MRALGITYPSIDLLWDLIFEGRERRSPPGPRRLGPSAATLMKTRNWPIRSKIITLVAVPIAALLVLWIFATTLTVGPAFDLLNARTLLDEVGRPGETLVAELQRERRLSVIFLAGRGDASALNDQRTRTDQAVAEFRRRTTDPGLRKVADDLLDARLDQLLAAVDTLTDGRDSIDRRQMDRTGALGRYSGVIDAAFRTFSAMIVLPDEEIAGEARVLTALGRAREVLAQSDALLAGVFTAGQFAPGEHGQLVQIIGAQRFLYADAVAELPERDRGAYQRLTQGDPFTRLRTLEETLVGRGSTGAAPPVDAGAWQDSYETVQQQLREFELSAAAALAERGVPVAVRILGRLALAGVLGLVAVLLSAFIALGIGRSLVHRLTGLRGAALELAGERLPDVVGRLRRGEAVDLDREAPPLDYGGDEIGQVGQAFSEVQRTAVRSAVDEAALRRGLSDVFLNIARRSQTLLHRQLALLDRMERRTTEPDELADLFQVDHMATRMRRHAEDLVVLAGAVPGRGWRNPVPVVDVIRGAISEVEDYIRVDIMTVHPGAIAGRAVGDVIHLLAELIENATAFSPPYTRVRIAGRAAPDGYVIEVEDRGLGMSAKAMAEANQRLTDPPDFDPANSARLGLFVVAQLGIRHGVRVELRPSPYGGVVAVAVVPGGLIVPDIGIPTQAGRPAKSPAGAPADKEQPTETSNSAEAVTEPTMDSRQIAVLLAARRLAGSTRGGPAEGRPTPDVAAGRPTAGAQPTRTPVGADGLPRRIRQTSLAPQLRDTSPASSVRTPEEIRAAMSALQAGTERGRREAAVPSVDPDANRVADPGSTEPGRDRK